MSRPRSAAAASAFCAIVCVTALASTLWISRPVPSPGGSVDRVMFVDQRHGWISGLFDGVLKTNNGGDTWSLLRSNLRTEHIGAVYFVTKDDGWAVGTSRAANQTRGVILESHDGGRSWRVQTRLGGEISRLYDIWFVDRDHGWAVGSQGTSALVLATQNGGAQWDVQYEGHEFTPELFRIAFSNSKTGWAMGPYSLIGTIDGGKTWTLQYKDSKAVGLYSLSVVDNEEVWAAGGWNFILHTTDGGANWSQGHVPEGSGTYLAGISFADRNQGWTCGAKGSLFSTTDGGRTWRKEESLADGVLSDIAVTSSRVFVTADPSQVLVRSR